MNLTEYILQIGTEVLEQPTHRIIYYEGFISALQLNLPIKFAEWKADKVVSVGRKFIIKPFVNIGRPDWIQTEQKYTLKEVYDYWIKNIFTI